MQRTTTSGARGGPPARMAGRAWRRRRSEHGCSLRRIGALWRASGEGELLPAFSEGPRAHPLAHQPLVYPLTRPLNQPPTYSPIHPSTQQIYLPTNSTTHPLTHLLNVPTHLPTPTPYPTTNTRTHLLPHPRLHPWPDVAVTKGCKRSGAITG